MKDSGIPWIGEIPEGWEVTRHKNIMFKKKDIQEHYSGENIISLTMNGVVIRDLTAGGKIPLSFDGYQKVQPGNLLLCLFDIDVTPRCVGLIKNDGVTSPAYSQFVLLKNANAPYFDYLLRYMDDYKCLLHLSKNLRSSLTETDFGMIPTCLPPLAEQEAIAAFLDRKCGEVDEMVSLQEQVIDELKAYKQSVITEAVTKGLNPSAPMKPTNIDWIGQIPTHWEICQINALAMLQSGNSLKTEDITDNVELYPVYGGNGIRGYYKDYLLDGRYVLIGRQGALCGNIKVTKEKFWVTEHAVICYPKHDFNTSWFAYMLESMNLNQYSLSAAQPGLAIDRIKRQILVLPPLSEQREIADYLDRKCADIDALIALKQQKIEELKQYKKSLIYEYVTGKKQVFPS